MQDPAFVDILIFLVAAFGLLIVGVMIMFVRVYSRLQKLQSNLTSEQTEIRKEAQKQADDIVNKAQINAQEMIKNSEKFNDHATKVFEIEMKKATRTYADKYQVLLNEVERKIESMYQKISESISLASVKSAKTVDSNLQKNLVFLSESIGKEVENLKSNLESVASKEKERIQSEYLEAKRAKLEHLDSTIIEAVQRVSAEVISKGLTVSDHEDLVLESLKSAKKEGFFNE